MKTTSTFKKEPIRFCMLANCSDCTFLTNSYPVDPVVFGILNIVLIRPDYAEEDIKIMNYNMIRQGKGIQDEIR